MKKTLLKCLVLMLSISTLVACGKKKDDSVAVNAGRNVRVWPSNLPMGQGTMAGSQGAWLNAEQDPTQYSETIKVFVSTTMDPSFVGTVSNNNGVEIRGQVYVNAQSGAVSNVNSQIQLTIRDSFSISGDPNGSLAEPIVVKVAGASGYASYGRTRLTFTDQYGSVIIDGEYNSGTGRMTGTVSFTHAQPRYRNQSQGYLGRFDIPTCAFFVCQ
jgi:hypothetical protein